MIILTDLKLAFCRQTVRLPVRHFKIRQKFLISLQFPKSQSSNFLHSRIITLHLESSKDLEYFLYTVF
jgi:hypothetical protein